MLLSCKSFTCHADIKKGEFAKLVRSATRGQTLPDDEVDLLYRSFDTNRDGFLSLGEMIRADEKLRFGLNGDQWEYQNGRQD